MISFIHCADLHLGRSFQTAAGMDEESVKKAADATFESFRNIISEAVKRRVNFVLISGDVYDRKERSLKSQWFFKQQAEILNRNGIPVYVVHGNHDPLPEKDDMITMPKNVYIFPPSVRPEIYESPTGEKAVIYGFSYPERSYTDDPVPQYKKINEPEAWHIGILHGQEKGQKEHDPYAPFTLNDLLDTEFDYWALGHIHKRQVLHDNPPVVYPGNIQGCHRKETGAKGAYYIELHKQGADLKFIETSLFEWKSVLVDISNMQTVDEFITSVEEKTDPPSRNNNIVLKVTAEGNGPLHHVFTSQQKCEEVSALISEEFEREGIWIDQVLFKTSADIDRDKLASMDHIPGDIVRLAAKLKEDKEWRRVLEPVQKHRKIKHFTASFNEETEDEIIQEAEKILLSALMEGEEYG